MNELPLGVGLAPMSDSLRLSRGPGPLGVLRSPPGAGWGHGDWHTVPVTEARQSSACGPSVSPSPRSAADSPASRGTWEPRSEGFACNFFTRSNLQCPLQAEE